MDGLKKFTPKENEKGFRALLQCFSLRLNVSPPPSNPRRCPSFCVVQPVINSTLIFYECEFWNVRRGYCVAQSHDEWLLSRRMRESFEDWNKLRLCLFVVQLSHDLFKISPPLPFREESQAFTWIFHLLNRNEKMFFFFSYGGAELWRMHTHLFPHIILVFSSCRRFMGIRFASMGKTFKLQLSRDFASQIFPSPPSHQHM